MDAIGAHHMARRGPWHRTRLHAGVKETNVKCQLPEKKIWLFGAFSSTSCPSGYIKCTSGRSSRSGPGDNSVQRVRPGSWMKCLHAEFCWYIDTTHAQPSPDSKFQATTIPRSPDLRERWVGSNKTGAIFCSAY